MTAGSSSSAASLISRSLRLAGAAAEEQADADLPRLAVLADPVGDGDDAVGRMLAEGQLADDVLQPPRPDLDAVLVADLQELRRGPPATRASRRSAPLPAPACAGRRASPGPTVRAARFGVAACGRRPRRSRVRQIRTSPAGGGTSAGSAASRRSTTTTSTLGRRLDDVAGLAAAVGWPSVHAAERSRVCRSRADRRDDRTGGGTAAACRAASARCGRCASTCSSVNGIDAAAARRSRAALPGPAAAGPRRRGAPVPAAALPGAAP